MVLAQASRTVSEPVYLTVLRDNIVFHYLEWIFNHKDRVYQVILQVQSVVGNEAIL